MLFQFDLIIIIPTSTSEIELAATATFIARHSWIFNSRTHVPPNLLIAPTRIRTDQLHGNAFTQQRFPVPFLLSPPILESQSAREAYEYAYLKDLPDACGQSFREFGNAVYGVKPCTKPKYSNSPTSPANTHATPLGASQYAALSTTTKTYFTTTASTKNHLLIKRSDSNRHLW